MRKLAPRELRAADKAAEQLAQVIHTHHAACACPLCNAWWELDALAWGTKERARESVRRAER
jgi:hypothetical protein